FWVVTLSAQEIHGSCTAFQHRSANPCGPGGTRRQHWSTAAHAGGRKMIMPGPGVPYVTHPAAHLDGARRSHYPWNFMHRQTLSGLVLAACLFSPVRGFGADDAAFLRVFLKDGTTLVSYGEFARVGDRVVFSMPLGGPQDNPELQPVNI